jgi:hypothetical protein
MYTLEYTPDRFDNISSCVVVFMSNYMVFFFFQKLLKIFLIINYQPSVSTQVGLRKLPKISEC